MSACDGDRPPAGLLDLGAASSRQVGVHLVVDDDRGALVGQARRQRAADPAGAAGDQGDLARGEAARGSVTCRDDAPEDIAGDDRLLDLVGALLEALGPRVAVDPLDRVRRPEADAAVDLQGLVGDPGQHVDRGQLGHRGERAPRPGRRPPSAGPRTARAGARLRCRRRSRRARRRSPGAGPAFAEGDPLARVRDGQLLGPAAPARRRSSRPRSGSGVRNPPKRDLQARRPPRRAGWPPGPGCARRASGAWSVPRTPSDSAHVLDRARRRVARSTISATVPSAPLVPAARANSSQ